MDRESASRIHEANLLSRKAALAGRWAFALRASEQAGIVARTIILARLLNPDAFGTVALAMLSIGTLQVFTELGVKSVLVVHRDNSSADLNSAWTLNLIRNFALYALLLLLSAPLSEYFNDPELTSVIPVLALMLLIDGFTNIGVIQFDRELEFKARFRLHAAPILVDLIVAVSTAVLIRSLWALVVGTLVGAVARLTLSYLLHPYRPRVQIEREAFSGLLVLGKWFFAQGVLIFLFLHVDDWVVGRVSGVTALGLYSVAYSLSQIATTEVTAIIGSVAFPLYARLRDEPDRIHAAFRSVVQLTSVVGLPLAAGVIIVGPTLVGHILGEPWQEMGTALRLLGVWGILRSLGAPAGFLLNGIGRPGLAMIALSTRLMVLSVLIYPLTSQWGISGAAGAVAIASTFDMPVMVRVATKTVGMGLRSWAAPALWPLVAVAIAGLPSAGVLVALENTLKGAVLAGGAFLLVYLAMLMGLEHLGLISVRKTLRGFVGTQTSS